MSRMRRVVVLAFGFALALQATAAPSEQARQRFEELDRKYRLAQREVDEAETHLRQLKMREQELPKLIEKPKLELATAAMKVEQVADAVNAATEEQGKAMANLAQKRPHVAEAEKRAEESKQAVEAQRRVAAGELQNSEAFKKATQDVKVAREKVGEATVAALHALNPTAKYQSLKSEVGALEAKVKALRAQSPTPQSLLAETSNTWIDATNALKKLEEEAISADPGVKSSSAAQNAADGALAKLNGEMERKLAGDPAVQAAKAKVTTEHTLLNAAKAEFQKAENERNSTARALERAKENYSLVMAQRRRLSADHAARVTESKRLSEDLREAEQRLDRAREEVAATRREREESEREWKRLEEQEERVPGKR